MSDKEKVIGEEVEVVAWWDDSDYNSATTSRAVLHDWLNNGYPVRELMTVAQHQRITEALRGEVDRLMKKLAENFQLEALLKMPEFASVQILHNTIAGKDSDIDQLRAEVERCKAGWVRCNDRALKAQAKLNSLRAQLAQQQVPDDLRGICMLVAEAGIKHGRGRDRAVSADECREVVDSVLAAAPAPAQVEPASPWVAVSERLPSSRVPVLARYTNDYGHGRTIRAWWLAKFQQESENIDNFDADYDEESDTYYDPKGWYELIDNWGDYSSVAVTEGTITHWMPMPLPPAPEVKP
jgi:hypothetical protein